MELNLSKWFCLLSDLSINLQYFIQGELLGPKASDLRYLLSVDAFIKLGNVTDFISTPWDLSLTENVCT